MIGAEGRYIGEIDLEITPINNRVILRIDHDPENERSEAGLIMGSTSWEHTEHLCRFGTVVSVCDRLYEREYNGFGIEWGTSIEVEIGDVCYFTKMEADNATLFKKDGAYYLIADYAELILRIRDGVYYPLNGYIILDKIEETDTSDWLNLDFTKKHNKKKGIVRWVGKKLDYYFPKSSNIVELDCVEGDSVLFSLSGFTSLEDKRYAKLDDTLGYLQRRWIVAKIA